jgi:hypothetical protein
MPKLPKPHIQESVLMNKVAFLAILSSLFAPLSLALGQSGPDENQARPDATTAPTTYAEFQYATLTGTTNTINATLVPVVTSSGTVYKNLTFQVTVSSTGVITIVAGSPTVVASPTTQAAGFEAGTYVGPNFGSGSEYNGMLVTVSGPGVVAGGYTDWSLATASGATSTCPYLTSATWYVGSPTSTNNPLYARLKKDGITSTAYSYGTAGDGGSGCEGAHWYQGTLIGVSQTGSAVTISSFTYDGTDYSTPQDQITFTLK